MEKLEQLRISSVMEIGIKYSAKNNIKKYFNKKEQTVAGEAEGHDENSWCSSWMWLLKGDEVAMKVREGKVEAVDGDLQSSRFI